MKVSQTIINGDQLRWRCAYMLNGKEAKRHFRTKAEADQHAAEVAGELKAHGQEAALPLAGCSTGDRLAIMQIIEEAKKAGLKLSDVVPLITAKATPGSISVEKCIAQALESKERQGLAAKSLVGLKSNWAIFARQFGPRELASIAPLEVEKWLNGNGWAPATKRSKRTDISTLFSYACKFKYCAENPCDAVARPIQDSKPPGILSVADCAKILSFAREFDPGLLGYIVPALFCGIRPGELARIPREAVNIERRFVRIDFSKNRAERRLVTLPECAAQWLAPGTWQLPPPALRDRLERLRLRAGLWKEWPHDAMRHSFGSYHYALLDNANLTAKEMGNSPDVLFKHYRELVTKEEAKAFFALTPDSVPRPAKEDIEKVFGITA